MDHDELRRLADGRVYLAPEAVQNGLVDTLGTLSDALDAAQTAAGLEGRPIVMVEYARPYQHRPNIYAHAANVPAQVNLINLELPGWLREATPTFMYIWAPAW